MFWVKVGIIIVGSLYALLLPYVIYRAVESVKIDLNSYTLSFLSNKRIYNKTTAKGYTRLLLVIALVHYIFFSLLTRYYFLGEEERYLNYVNYSSLFLTLLGCVRHNILPYSFKTLRAAILRIGHNILAVIVFLVLPALIISFQTLIVDEHKFIGIGGFIIIGAVLAWLILSIVKRGINGVTELVFITGISIWSIFVTVITVFFT